MTKEQFEKTYVRLFPKTCALARRLGAQDPEEIAQAAWTRAWAALPTWREASSFETWINRITFNETMGFHRKNVPLVELAAEPADDSEVQKRESAQMVEWLFVQVNKLPPLYRQILLLRLSGMNDAASSAKLGVTVECVKSRVLRATNMLREQVN